MILRIIVIVMIVCIHGGSGWANATVLHLGVGEQLCGPGSPPTSHGFRKSSTGQQACIASTFRQ